MEFKKIHTDADIMDFMKQFSFFHDSCIKEIHYISGSFVTDDRSMHPVNSKRNLSIIFESQQAKCKTVELLFDKIVELHLIPETEDYDCVIQGVFFKRINNLFYWANWMDFSPDSLPIGFGTYIIAESVSWREKLFEGIK